ncbi:CAP domain-containing protein [Aquimarina sp. 433]
MNTFLKYLYVVLAIAFVTSCASEDDTDNLSEQNSELVNELNIADAILTLVNQHRQSQGLSSLSKNNTAEQLAIDHTRYMISVEQINHDDFAQRSDALNDQENATASAENVARFYQNAQSVVDGWLNSSGHKDNIEGNYTYTGIAAIKDENGRYYYTQLFYR